jgi:hypothetical protein
MSRFGATGRRWQRSLKGRSCVSGDLRGSRGPSVGASEVLKDNDRPRGVINIHSRGARYLERRYHRRKQYHRFRAAPLVSFRSPRHPEFRFKRLRLYGRKGKGFQFCLRPILQINVKSDGTISRWVKSGDPQLHSKNSRLTRREKLFHHLLEAVCPSYRQQSQLQITASHSNKNFASLNFYFFRGRRVLRFKKFLITPNRIVRANPSISPDNSLRKALARSKRKFFCRNNEVREFRLASRE